MKLESLSSVRRMMRNKRDTAWMDKDGYFWFNGRIDDVIKTGGFRVGPFEIESALMEHPAIMECSVIGVPDELRDKLSRQL